MEHLKQILAGIVVLTTLAGLTLLVSLIPSRIYTPTAPVPEEKAVQAEEQSDPTEVLPESDLESEAATTTENVAGQEEGGPEGAPEIVLEIPGIPLNLPDSHLDEIGEIAKSAAVNILCTYKYGNITTSVNGSGMFVDSRGVILTNAHVAQFLLLDDKYECLIRQGSPVEPKYVAEILYLPPAWIDKNSGELIAETPMGNGEYDFAFLYVTEALPGEMLPTSFPHIEIDPLSGTGDGEGILYKEQEVVVVGYPAELFKKLAQQDSLIALDTVVTVEKLQTFRDQTLDVLTLEGSILAQAGSSGSAVVGENEKVLGLVVAATSVEQFSERSLSAITSAHIERSLQKFRGITIEDLLSGNLNRKTTSYSESIAPNLKSILDSELDK